MSSDAVILARINFLVGREGQRQKLLPGTLENNSWGGRSVIQVSTFVTGGEESN